jgi:hypothetical protein
VWTRGTGGIFKAVKGEVGVLKEVYYDAGTSTKCFLVIDYQSQSYTGCITCLTRSFCTQLTHFLRDHIGRSIEDIGDLDVSYTFSPLSRVSKIEMYKRSSPWRRVRPKNISAGHGDGVPALVCECKIENDKIYLLRDRCGS